MLVLILIANTRSYARSNRIGCKTEASLENQEAMLVSTPVLRKMLMRAACRVICTDMHSLIPHDDRIILILIST